MAAQSPILGVCFKHEVDEVFYIREYPKREFTMSTRIGRALHPQAIESARHRLERLREGGGECPMYTLVLFNNADSLRRNASGAIRYHRDSATEERYTITS